MIKSVKCIQNETEASILTFLNMDWEAFLWHGFCFGFWSRNQFPVDYSMQNMPIFYTDICSRTDSVNAVVFESHFVSHLCPWLPRPEIFGNVWSHLWLSQFGRDATRIWWVEAREAAKHPRIHRTGPTAKNELTQNVNSAEAEELWVEMTLCRYLGAQN